MNDAVAVSASVDLPLPPDDVFARLAEPATLPGRILSRGRRRISFSHDGIKGWLPVDDATGELSVDGEGRRSRVTLSVRALARSAAAAEVATARLTSWLRAALASRIAPLTASRV